MGAIRRGLSSLEDVRAMGERCQALDLQRRDLLAQRGLHRQRAERVATEIIREDRRRLGAGLEETLPLPSSSVSETEPDVNSEDRRATAIAANRRPLHDDLSESSRSPS